MHGYAVRLHDAGNANLLVRGIGDELGRFMATPTPDEVVAGGVQNFAREVAVDPRRAGRADAEIVEPGAQRLGLDAVPPGQLRDVELALGRTRLRGGRQALA